MHPSTEYLTGMNNICIGSEGNVTMFDFDAHRYENDAESKRGGPGGPRVLR